MTLANYFVYVFLLQLSSNVVWSQRSFANPAVIDPAACACDLQANQCDSNCCCDTDCTTLDRQAISTCKSTPSSYPSEDAIRVWNCSNDTSSTAYDYFPLVCVQFTNNEVSGKYFPTDNLQFVKTVNDISSLRTSFITQYPELFESTTSSSATSNRYSTVGTPVRVSSSRILTVPSRLAGIQCQSSVPVLFRVNRDVSCTLLSSNDPCSTILSQTSVLMDGETSTSTVPFTFYQKIITAPSTPTRSDTAEYYFQDSYPSPISSISTTYSSINDYCPGLHPTNRTQRYTFCNTTDPSTCDDYQTFGGCPLRDSLSYSTINTNLFTARAASTDDSYNFVDFGGVSNVSAITCSGNVALRIFYRFNVSISTNTISTAEVFVILQSFSTPSTSFNQRITIEWNNVSDSSNANAANFPRGYLTGEVLQFRRNSTTGNQSSDVSMLLPSSNGLCIDATRVALRYKQGGSSFCSVQLTQATVSQCHELKLNMYLYLNIFYAPASYVMPFPSSNSSTLMIPIRSTAQDLIELDRIDETRPNNRLNLTYIAATRPARSQFTVYDSATSLSTCFGVPSGLYIKFGFARLPLSGTAFEEYIVSVQYNYTYSDWQFRCTSASCTSASTQKYLVTSKVEFVDVTSQFWNQSDTTRADLTSADDAIEHLLWLVTPEFSGEPGYRKYTIAMILIFIASSVIVLHVLLFGLMCPF